MMPGMGPDPVTVVRGEFWAQQIPATVMPAPTGGIAAYFESGEQLVFPDLAAVKWFLTGWKMGEQSGGEATLPTEQTAQAPEPGQGEPTEEG